LIKCMYVCPTCKKNHLKDDSGNSGDWHNTEWGVILQSFCPECGKMEPLIYGERVSQRKLKGLATRIAMKFGRDFDTCRSIAKESDGVDYIQDFSSKLGLTHKEVSSVTKNEFPLMR